MQMKYWVTGDALERLNDDGRKCYSRELCDGDTIHILGFDGFKRLHFQLDWPSGSRTQVSGEIVEPISETFLFRGSLKALKELVKSCAQAQHVMNDPRMVV